MLWPFYQAVAAPLFVINPLILINSIAALTYNSLNASLSLILIHFFLLLWCLFLRFISMATRFLFRTPTVTVFMGAMPLGPIRTPELDSFLAPSTWCMFHSVPGKWITFSRSHCTNASCSWSSVDFLCLREIRHYSAILNSKILTNLLDFLVLDLLVSLLRSVLVRASAVFQYGQHPHKLTLQGDNCTPQPSRHFYPQSGSNDVFRSLTSANMVNYELFTFFFLRCDKHYHCHSIRQW